MRQPGEYTIAAEDAGRRTTVTTRAGEAEVTGRDERGYVVGADTEGVFVGEDPISGYLAGAGARSGFEAWSYDRDRAQSGSMTSRYVAPGVIGRQDLDRNGTWAYESGYGTVWHPTTFVFADWAPYRYGRWTWISPWGWTWIDDAPWGFAPFHYGRWVNLRQRWCWVPGPLRTRPVYAPALVGWTGNPYQGFANVGWFPLAPREVYLPGYRATWRHFYGVNVANAAALDRARLADAYRNRSVRADYRNRGAVTIVDRAAFASAGHAGRNRVHVDPRDAARWRALATPPPVTPDRRAVLGGQPKVRTSPHDSRIGVAPNNSPMPRGLAPDTRAPRIAVPPADLRLSRGHRLQLRSRTRRRGGDTSHRCTFNAALRASPPNRIPQNRPQAPGARAPAPTGPATHGNDARAPFQYNGRFQNRDKPSIVQRNAAATRPDRTNSFTPSRGTSMPTPVEPASAVVAPLRRGDSRAHRRRIPRRAFAPTILQRRKRVTVVSRCRNPVYRVRTLPGHRRSPEDGQRCTDRGTPTRRARRVSGRWMNDLQVADFTVVSAASSTCPQDVRAPRTSNAPGYPQLIHRSAPVISLPNARHGVNVCPTDARHAPPRKGSQTTQQSAGPARPESPGKVAQGRGDPQVHGTSDPALPTERITRKEAT